MKWVHKRGTALAVQSLSKRLQGFRHWSAALSLTKLAGFVAVFAIVGVLILLAAHAATGASILGLSPQNGRLCGNAAVVSDPSAVGGSALKFGTGGGGPSCPGGTPTLSQTGELSAYLAELINGNGSTTPLCLADQNNSSADNNPVVVDGCSATAPEQQWSLYSDNSIRINGKCLSPQNGKTQSGTAVVIAACDGTAAQQWNIGNDVSVSLNDLHNGGASGVCLDVPNAEMTSVPGDTPGGSAVTILNCDGTLDEQIWGWNTDGTITPGGVTAGANCHDSATLYSGFGTCYWEAHGIQHSPFSSTGFSVDMTQASPKVPVYNRVGTISHSLMEVWAGGGTASSGGGGTLNFGSTPADTLEFGWIKNGDGKPSHLFVTYWQNYTLRCDAESLAAAQTCGFVSTSSIAPGSTVTTGATGTYKITLANNQWQFWYNGTEIGYFPMSVFTSLGDNSFTSITYLDVFGEVAVPYGLVTKTQMGNGTLGTDPGATSFSNFSLIGSTAAADLEFNGTEPIQAYQYAYDYGNTGPTGFSVGGPGL